MECFTTSHLAISVCVFCMLSPVRLHAQSRVHEVQVLTSFKKAMDISDNIDLEGGWGLPYTNYWFTWNETDENPCKWVGVMCTTNFTVGALDLSGWPLRSLKTVEVLSQLPDLRELDMSGCGLLDIQDINSLTHLIWLDLSNNNFGSIPTNISASRTLQYLSLESCNMKGTIPDLSALVNLQFLILAHNSLSGPFPKELGGISSLVHIDLSRNRLNGSVPSLVNSISLVNLTLDYNNFDGFEEAFYLNAPNLRYLRVAGNQLEGTIPVGITKLLRVIVIDISGNRLSGSIPPNITKLPKLRALVMSRNRLAGSIPSGISNLISSNLVGFLFDCSENQLSGSIPPDMLQLEPTPRLHTLGVYINASFNLLNGRIPAPTARRTMNVSINLDLSNNRLEGPVPPQLSGIYSLDLHNNLLSGDIVDVLAESKAFQPASFLYLRNNSFTGDLTKISFDWAAWTWLRKIDLSNNSLSWRPTESIPDPVGAALGSFSSALQGLWASGNNFSGTSLPIGPLSRVNGRLGNFFQLDLSGNRLEGVISGAVFNSTWLPRLQLLNLSNNQITGAVPESITGFSLLGFLDLANNKLSGKLPELNSSSVFSSNSFAGNPGLCGYPLLECVSGPRQTITWWMLVLIVGGSVMIALGSCLVATWRWRVYRKRHQQDADLIRTLMERDLVTLMPLRHLMKATNGFAETARIGEGGFGTVYKGTLSGGTTVAIKRAKREGSDIDKEQFLNEVRILSQVNHRHLVKLLGCCMENKVALLVFEFVSNGTLQEHLRGKVGDHAPLSWKQRLTIAVQTADALNYLHSAATLPIYHRDVKSANILLDDDLSAKVADFGISKLVPEEATHISTALQGTMGYIDPEYWTSFQLTDKSDVYSFGVVLLELISAKPAVDQKRGGEDSSLVFFADPHIKRGDIKPLIDPALMETYSEPDGRGRESILSVGRLAMKCLQMRSKARPSMIEVSKELLNLWLELPGSSMKEGLGYTNEEDQEKAQQAVLLSHILSTDRSDTDRWSSTDRSGPGSGSSSLQLEARSLELLDLSRVAKRKSQSMQR